MQNPAQGRAHSASWQARQAVLALLAVYLQASPAVQRLAVLKWNVVAALFGLLWEAPTQKLALDMVRHRTSLFIDVQGNCAPSVRRQKCKMNLDCPKIASSVRHTDA